MTITAEQAAKLVADAHLAAKVMADTGTFETGQAILLDLAAALIASEAARKLAEERLAKATKLLAEADGDLSVYVGAEYPAVTRAKYPSVERQWQRDMQLCREIGALLKEIDNG